MEWRKRQAEWLCSPLLDEELRLLLGQKDEWEDCFSEDLTFGTGGLRGKLGPGPNCMNVHTVSRATRGLAAYLNTTLETPSCAIAYDSRVKSERFARLAAAELAARGVKVFLYKELMPTPMLSFAVRLLHCSAGIVITASHNPANYNGYKVYGEDGCQITPEAASAIQAEIAAQTEFAEAASFEEYIEKGNICLIGEDVEQAYYAALCAQTGQLCSPLYVVYSPLNGTGNKPVRRMLASLGVSVSVVKEQEQPDGTFPTCPYPNPEVPQAMELAAQQAAREKSDLFLATDPDCDRVGVGVIVNGKVRIFNGNEIGVLLLDYICHRRTEEGTMPKGAVAVKTIVTTEMACVVAKSYHIEMREVLTGFKYIGEQIGLLERQGGAERFLFGFEESCGYLSYTDVRDKDGVNGAMLVCEMAAWHKAQGRTLAQAWEQLCRTYGYHTSSLLSFAFEGTKGMQKMKQIMQRLRTAPPPTLGGRELLRMVDYQTGVNGLPRSDVLALELENSRVVVRPSGTEPKLKLYLSTRAADEDNAYRILDALEKACGQLVEVT